MKNTHGAFTIAFLTGSPGAGKTYHAALDLVDRLATSDVHVRTNLPFNLDEVATRVAGRSGESVEEVKRRVESVPRQLLRTWAAGEGGPWDGESEGWDLILDEVHLFCPTGERDRHKKWESWLGEARHDGWRRIVFITQDESKVGKPITAHAELRYELTKTETLRDPWTGIPLGAWYDLRASLAGSKYSAPVVLDEFRRSRGRMKLGHREWFTLDPVNFSLYDSYSAAGGGVHEGATTAQQHECDKRPRFVPNRQGERLTAPVWAWFVGRFWPQLLRPIAIASVLVWACFLGGGPWLMTMFMGTVRQMVVPQGSEAEQVADEPEETQEQRVTIEQYREAVASVEASDTREVLRSWIDEQGEIERGLREEVASAEAEIAALNGRKRLNPKLVGMREGITYWSTGEILRVGEELEDGPAIELVDHERRQVALVGGDLVRLGGVYEYRVKEEPGAAEVGGVVQAGDEPDSPRDRVALRVKRELERGGHAPSDAVPPPGG